MDSLYPSEVRALFGTRKQRTLPEEILETLAKVKLARELHYESREHELCGKLDELLDEYMLTVHTNPIQ